MDIKPLPARPNPDQYRKQAKELAKKFGVKLADAQFTLAREHGFESWPRFAKHIADLARQSTTSQFEQAADAVILGDVATLARLLNENPILIRARSARLHRATLLHYIAANGFEDYRQKTPANAVEIATILLDAGAEVDALSASYGGQDTTLVLVATSAHPARAGVQIPLLQLLLDRGAAPDGVNACLANGRPEAAEFLARRGAPVNLEAAAGLGLLDLVQKLLPESTPTLINRGLWWASEYGRNIVVDFLLDHGADLRAGENTAMPALHWAIVGGQLETVKLLLKRGASLEAKNGYGGAALDCAQWCVANSGPNVDYAPILKLLTAGLSTGSRPQGGS